MQKNQQMKTSYINLFVALLLIAGVSCKKDGFGPLTDNQPDVPLVVSNATDFRPGPTVRVSKATGQIQFVLSIPASSGRTIKEITKIAAATSVTTIQGATGLYVSTPIAASGTSVTYNTTLTEYTTKTGQTVPAVNTELGRRFYFLVTLDDNTQIISSEVRVLVVD